MLKVGFIGNSESISKYLDSVQQAAKEEELVTECDVLRNPLQMAKRLFHWANKDFDAVVVLDEGISDKEEMFGGIQYFVSKSKDESTTRVIFVASDERLSSDEDVCALAYSGVFDLVLPFRGDEPISSVISLIKTPATVENVRYIVGSGSKAFSLSDYEAKHPDLLGKKSQEGKETKASEDSAPKDNASVVPRQVVASRPGQIDVPIPGQSVIAVTSLVNRGGSTTLAFHIAASIGQVLFKYSLHKPKYHTVAVVTCKETFDALKGVYGNNFELVDEGCAKFFGYDVFVGHTSGVAGRNYTHVILDCGWVPLKKVSGNLDLEEAQQILEYRSQLSVMAVPMGTVQDIQAFVSLTKDQENAILKRMSYVMWGASEELASQAKDAVRRHWPTAWIEAIGWVLRPEVPSKEIDPQIIDLVEPYLDIECVRAYKSALKRKAQQSSSVNDESEVEKGSTSAENTLEEKKRKFSFGALFYKAK